VVVLQEGIDAISDVIYHVETYDTTSIRASTPMFLMSRKIKAHGVKMVLSGEGSDEIFGGYLYFHKAPNKVRSCHEAPNMVLRWCCVARAGVQGLGFKVKELQNVFAHTGFSSLLNIRQFQKPISRPGSYQTFSSLMVLQ
jgi:Asparagine synthase